jgi:hypothetical protein
MAERRRRETALALVLTILFLAAAGFVAWHHEIWRDEAEPWLVAKASRSLDDLALRIRFEGHPALWYWGLFLLTRFTRAPQAMQIVHLLIAAAAVFLFARSAPFPRTVRVLFAFSYFPFYEYGVISRDYALGMLLLFAFCAVFPRRNRSLLGPAAVLVLLAQTHLLMFILASILAFLLAAERFWKRREARPRFLAAGAVFVLLGLALAAYQIVPVGESTFSTKLDFSYMPAKAGTVIRAMSKTFVAVPEPRLNFWGNSILNLLSGPVGVIGRLVGPLFFFFALLALLDRPLALSFYVLSTLALLSFYYLVHLGLIRHHGILFLAFLAAFWLAGVSAPGPRRPGRLRAVAAGARRFAPAVLGIILSVQIAATAMAASYDIRYPFSQAKRAADFIKLQGLRDWVLIGDTHLALAGVSAYLDRPFYFPYIESWGTYALYVHGVHVPMTMTPIVAAAERLSRETGQEYLLVLSYPLDEASLTTRGLRPVAGFGSAIVDDEVFYLYRKERRESLIHRLAAK